MRAQAVWAAVTVGAETFGRASTRPVVLQDTNNIVIHLAPGPVVAKVGRSAERAEVLDRELRVGRHLAAAGAPVAAPMADLVVDPGTGLPVTFWEYLAPVDEAPSAAAVADALAAVHAALVTFPDPLPSFAAGLDRVGATLADDVAMAALPPPDLALLREAFAGWVAEAKAHALDRAVDLDLDLEPAALRPLHGEPHAGNVIATGDGPRFIDFEAACIGPIEADLACVDPAVLAAGDFDVDPATLDLFRKLTSASVATWCWASDHPEMRPHAEHHLDLVRAATARR